MNKRNLIIGIVAVLLVAGLGIVFKVGLKDKFGAFGGKIASRFKEAERITNPDERISVYKEIIKDYPNSARLPEAWYKLAQSYEEQKKLPDAKLTYQIIVDKYPDSPQISDAQKRLENLNVQLLFSQYKTDESIVYEVASGDTLGKIAKKFNTTVELITKSNRLKDNMIRLGQRLKVVNGKFSIIVDKSQNSLILKLNDKVFKTYIVSTGLENSTPTGRFQIVNKLKNPVWYKAGAIVPSGSPENILGTHWIGISMPGYGIHGTTDPTSMGKQITAGCVRMLNGDVEELYTIVPVGTEVTIVD